MRITAIRDYADQTNGTAANWFYLVTFFLFTLSGMASANGLAVQMSGNGTPYITYNGTPAFGYGASPQNILTHLPAGNGDDYKAWVTWAQKYGMNLVRSYPPSFVVETPSINLFKHATVNNEKFDLSRFNEDYFKELQQACRTMKDAGFFIHLQLWQAVSWKKQWHKNYYNPLNNINPELSINAGPGEFMNVENPVLLKHQKQYVHKILDATAKLGNVYFDIANEIGNGTASDPKWVFEMLNTIRQWEKKNNHQVLVTINDEGYFKDTDAIYKKSNLIIKDQGRWDEHLKARLEYKKPTISVRNIDWDYIKNKRLYFYGKNNLEINENKNLQIRGRKYWWRMYMAKVQMAAAYADTYDKAKTFPGAYLADKILKKLGFNNLIFGKMHASYDLNTLAEDNFVFFRNFIHNIDDFPNLLAYDNIINGHTAAHNYCLQSTKEVVVYLESPNGNANQTYPETLVSLTNLMLGDGNHNGFYYHPVSGVKVEFKALITNGRTKLSIPAFNADLAIYIQ